MKKEVMNKRNNNRAFAFTLAEMMIVLAIISIVTVAMLPVMTKKQKDSEENKSQFWETMTDAGQGIDAKITKSQTVAIGNTANSLNDDTTTSKLLINTQLAPSSHIAFEQNGIYAGKLVLFTDGALSLGQIDTSVAVNNNGKGYVAIGSGTLSSSNAIAIGSGNSVKSDYSIAVGSSSQVQETAPNSIAIGSGAVVSSGAASSIAIGNLSNSKAGNSIALGSGSISEGSYSMALGANAQASLDGSLAIGYNSKSLSKGGTAIGSATVSTSSDYAISIGSETTASGIRSIAIGNSTNASASDSLAIGSSSNANASYSMAIGPTAIANDQYSIAVGYNSYAYSYGDNAIGYMAKCMSDPVLNTSGNIGSAVAIGSSALAYNAGISLGKDAFATTNSVSIGLGAGRYSKSYTFSNSEPPTITETPIDTSSYTNGIGNIAIGMYAYSGEKGDNTNGVTGYSTAIGYESLAKTSAVTIGAYSISNANSVAIGHSANASKLNTVVIGYSSLSNMSDAVIIGTKAKSDTWFQNLSTGYNVGIGSNSKVATEAVSVGSGATAAPKSVAIGKSSYAQWASSSPVEAGSVAVGYGAVAGTADWGDGNVSGAQAMGGGVAVGYNASAPAFAVAIGDNAVATYRHSVAIGAFAKTTACYQVVFGSTNTVAVEVNGKLTSVSDRRLKNVGSRFTKGLDYINKIKVYNYTYKNDKNKTLRVGVMAQDLQKIFPESVHKDSKGFLSIDQDAMFYAMINSIKELDLYTKNIIIEINTVSYKVKTLTMTLVSSKKKMDKLNSFIFALQNKSEMNLEKYDKLKESNNVLKLQNQALQNQNKILVAQDKMIMARLARLEKRVH